MTTPQRGWLLQEFERAKARSSQVPQRARPVIVRRSRDADENASSRAEKDG